MSWLFSDRPGTEQELTLQVVRALGLDGISSLLLFLPVWPLHVSRLSVFIAMSRESGLVTAVEWHRL